MSYRERFIDTQETQIVGYRDDKSLLLEITDDENPLKTTKIEILFGSDPTKREMTINGQRVTKEKQRK